MILLADLHEKLNKINLTQREKDILELYREGYTQKEIADALNFHQNHFNRHINSIAYKLIESGYKMV